MAWAVLMVLRCGAASQAAGLASHVLLLRAIDEMRAADAATRLAALKLLGLALARGGDAEVWGGQQETLLPRVVEQLQGMATIDESRDVRSLAHQLHSAAFSGLAG